MATSRNVRRMVGQGAWASVDAIDRNRVEGAILRDEKTPVLDLVFGQAVYNVELERRHGSAFEGEWLWLELGNRETGKVSAQLYHSESGCLLFGLWYEDGNEYHWWAKLSEVEHF